MSNPWDVRPLATKGDSSPEQLFQQIGAALTSWETAEYHLGELFDALVATPPSNRAAISAFAAVSSSSARTQLVQAAFEAAIAKEDLMHDQIADVIHSMIKLGPRRNEIAHGWVFNSGGSGCFLSPNNMSPKKWKDGTQTYLYNTDDVRHYVAAFTTLSNTIETVVNSLISRKVSQIQSA